MWRTSLLILVITFSLGAKVQGKFQLRQKDHRQHDRLVDVKESKQVKRDTVASPNGYPSLGQQYGTQTSSEQTASYNAAAYNTGDSSQSRSAMPYPASSPSPSPAAAPATTPAAATASPAASAAPASVAAAPAPAAAPAAAAAAPAPAPAPAAPAAAPAPATPVEASAPSRGAVPYPAAYQSSSTSYSFNVNPPPAPAPAPAPAPYYAYPAPAAYAYPAPAASATAVLAAAGGGKGHAKSDPTGAMCMDDERANNFCLKARNPCFCEENHHFMYNYCKDSCNWCDSSESVGHRFWRVVNEAHLPRSWVVNHVRFYSDKHAKRPIDTSDPKKAFASSSYLGYEPGSAFDNKSATYWLPNGWYDRGAGEDFIGYEFAQPVAVNSVRVVHQSGQGDVVSRKMYVEASDTYGGPYVTKWIIENPKGASNKRFNNKMCPLFWRRFSTDQGTYCFKLMTEFATWHDARDKCAEYGGDLASIKGDEEADFVKNQVQLCGYTWIGLNDMKNESDFQWSDGANLTYKSMSPQMDYVKDERADQEMDCIATDQNGQWTNFHCDDKFYSLCKKKLKPQEEEDEEDNDENDTEEHDHHHKHHKDHIKYHHSHKRKNAKLHKHNKVSLAEELKEAKSSSAEEEEDEESDEDAIREAVKAQKNSKQHSEEEEEDEDEEDNDTSGSGSGRSAITIPDHKSKGKNKKEWEF